MWLDTDRPLGGLARMGEATVALEQELRERLRGRRLVCELNFDEALRSRLVHGMWNLRGRGIASDANELTIFAPAITVAYLVGEGLFRYRSGQFWGNLEVDGLSQHVLGPAFERSIRALRLETLDQLVREGALRYVAPILAHGGIPIHSLGDFFRVLLDELRRGGIDAADVLARWRGSRSRFSTTDKPVERFLLNGGSVSSDLLERCIDLVRECPPGTRDIDPDRFGLPSYVCAAYASLDDQAKRSAAARIGSVIPRPAVVIDPYGAAGPLMVLPAVSTDFIGNYWNVIAGEMASRYRCSPEDRIMPLRPALAWNAELFLPNGDQSRVFPFAGLSESGALVFDTRDGRLIADPCRLRSPHVWLLIRQGTEVAAARGSLDPVDLRPTEVAPPLAGAWSGFELRAYNLTDVSRLILKHESDGRKGGRQLWVHVHGADIQLIGDALPGVLSAHGLPVFAELPKLRIAGVASVDSAHRWLARMEIDGRLVALDGQQLFALSGQPLSRAVGDDAAGNIKVYIRGPLGSDVRASFLLVPGLEIQRPHKILLPGMPPEAVSIRTSAMSPTTVHLQKGADTVACAVACADGTTRTIQIAVPLLSWAVAIGKGERGILGQSLVRLSAHEILDEQTALMIIRLRCNRFVTLQLCHGNDLLQEESARTAGPDGRWAFDLRHFADTLRTATHPLLRFRLLVDGCGTALAEVRSDLGVTNLRARCRQMPAYNMVYLQFEQGRAFPNRVARLWSLAFPWRAPITESVEDDSTEATILRPVDELPPGPYLAEIAVDDAWIAPTRPKPRSAGAADVYIGTTAELQHWLRSLPDDDAEAVLACAYEMGVVRRELTDEEAEQLVPAAVEALALGHAHQIGRNSLVAAADGIGQLLCPHSSALTRGFIQAASLRRNNDVPLLTVALDLMPKLVPQRTLDNTDDSAERLWDLCSPLAAAMDLPHADEGAVRDRIENCIGCTLPEAARRPIVPGVNELVMVLQLPLEQLEAIRRVSGLLPIRPLDLDNQALVHLEWIAACRSHAISVPRWLDQSWHLAREVPTTLAPRAVETFAQARIPTPVLERHPEAALPETVHACALHVMARTPQARQAAEALQKLIPSCAAIVARSLVLAAVHVHAIGVVAGLHEERPAESSSSVDQ